MSAMAEEIPHPSAFIPEEQDVVEDVRLPRPPAMTAHSYEQQQLTLMQMADRYDTLGKSFLDMAKTLRGAFVLWHVVLLLADPLNRRADDPIGEGRQEGLGQRGLGHH